MHCEASVRIGLVRVEKECRVVCEHCGDIFYVSKYACVCALFGKSSLKIPTSSFGVICEEGFLNKIVLLESFSCVSKTPTS